MLRSTCSNISIITNFGCNNSCWYCIWKNHKLKNCFTSYEKTDWNKLKTFMHDYDKVSLSGGGDPLYQFEENKKWWRSLFELTEDMKIDIHTRNKMKDDVFWSKINRCSFSSDFIYADEDFLLYLSKLTNVRIVHVVTHNTTEKMIEDYLKFQKKINCQFTIKELTGYDDNEQYSKIKEKYSKIYSLDYGDYNRYFMPDNSIVESFL